MADDTIDLPPGFRFHPTDEEIITHYLNPKVINPSFTATAIGDVDLNRCEPWDLPSKAKMGEKEWYFFCQRDRKYPTGMRTNRATEAGYWKATGKDKEIFRGKGVLVGMKKTLVFYKGRAPRGEKSNWVMHEFRLEGKASYTNLPRTAKDEWVVCRVFHKSMGTKKNPMLEISSMNSFGHEEVMDSPNLPPLMEHNSYFNPDVIIPTGSNSIASYFSTMDDQIGQMQDPNKSFFFPNSFSSMMNHECNNTPPPYYPQLPSPANFPQPANLGPYMHQDPAMLRALASTSDALGAIRRHCKAEQFSGQSIVSASQDTGLSTDHNTEISSKNMGSSYDHVLDDPTSLGQAIDLENLWKY